MDINTLRKLNSDIKIYSVEDTEFESFGRILEKIDTKEIIETAKKMELPESGSKYLPTVEDFELLDIASVLENECFGSLPMQIGYCWGHNSLMNATEWHTSSEINIAVTSFVLILGHIWDIKNNIIDSTSFKVFFVPEGTVLEVYSTSLHFCPCEVSENGFGCVVALPKGTNTDLVIKEHSSLLFKKNKWIMAHNDNKDLIARGVHKGINGKNVKINY